jgi:hypothetical protein
MSEKKVRNFLTDLEKERDYCYKNFGKKYKSQSYKIPYLAIQIDIIKRILEK